MFTANRDNSGEESQSRSPTDLLMRRVSVAASFSDPPTYFKTAVETLSAKPTFDCNRLHGRRKPETGCLECPHRRG